MPDLNARFDFERLTRRIDAPETDKAIVILVGHDRQVETAAVGIRSDVEQFIGSLEIGLGVLPLESTGSFIVRTRSGSRIIESPECLILATYHDASVPLVAFRLKRHAFVAAAVSGIASSVGGALGGVGEAKIASSVVKRVAVDVIDKHGRVSSYTHDHAVHSQRSAARFGRTYRVEGLFVSRRLPFPNRQHHVLVCVNQRPEALRQGNEANRLGLHRGVTPSVSRSRPLQRCGSFHHALYRLIQADR